MGAITRPLSFDKDSRPQCRVGKQRKIAKGDHEERGHAGERGRASSDDGKLIGVLEMRDTMIERTLPYLACPREERARKRDEEPARLTESAFWTHGASENPTKKEQRICIYRMKMGIFREFIHTSRRLSELVLCLQRCLMVSVKELNEAGRPDHVS